MTNPRCWCAVCTALALAPALAKAQPDPSEGSAQPDEAESPDEPAPPDEPAASEEPAPPDEPVPPVEAEPPDEPVPPDKPPTAAPNSAGSAADDDLERELAGELGEIQRNADEAPGEPAATQSNPAATPGGTASAYGLSNTMNPAISANFIVLGGGTNRSPEPASDEASELTERDDLASGIHLQEAELRLSAIVDPYFRADVTLAGNTEGVGFEEAYLSTLEIPWVTLRGGQLIANFGRHNLLHTHAFPFITAPLPWRALLGPEGLRGPGVSVDVLVPLPFYTELNLQAFASDWRPLAGEILDDPNTALDESVPDRRRPEDLAYLGHLKTLFDLTSSSTIELGGSFVAGRNGFAELSSIAGGDLTFKWRPIENEREHSVAWTAEYLRVQRNGAPTDRSIGGAYTGLRFQFLRRWWVQGRGALLGLPAGDEPRSWRAEGLLAFAPSEFSLLRLQYAYETGSVDPDPVHEVFVQGVVSIGPHPAHEY